VKTLVGLDALAAPAEGSSIAIGTFDGVHAGHRALIARSVRAAAEAGHLSVVVTWDRHPSLTLRPEAAPPQLTSLTRKVELIASLGVERLALLPFDEALSRWPPERFATEVLARGLGARSVWVGTGWRFGHKASGDLALLGRLGVELGFDTREVPLLERAGGPVSSTRVRTAVAEGELALAARLLERDFDIEGVVVHGEHRGKALGYPTANLAVEAGLAWPPRGVYAGEGLIDGRRLKAAINVGYNPQFGGDESSPLRIEAHLLDFSEEIYGRTLRIAFARRLRDERVFDSVPDLVAQIGRDVEAAARTGP
jgi:riboflavin kinase/FMN adenylyltransferase